MRPRHLAVSILPGKSTYCSLCLEALMHFHPVQLCPNVVFDQKAQDRQTQQRKTCRIAFSGHADVAQSRAWRNILAVVQSEPLAFFPKRHH